MTGRSGRKSKAGNTWRTRRGALLASLVLGAAACTLTLRREGGQCTSHADCQAIDLGYVCGEGGVCVTLGDASSEPPPAAAGTPLAVRDAGPPPADLSCGGLLGSSSCDPVTAWPCDIQAGETCDFSNSAGAFRCYALPTAVALCGFCDRTTEYCGPGLTCGGYRCERYCCADSDCGRGTCVRDLFYIPEIAGAGLCVVDSIDQCGPNPDFSEWLPALEAAGLVDAGVARDGGG